MSNDYALFIILLPNDFHRTTSTNSVMPNLINPAASTSSANIVYALTIPDSIFSSQSSSIHSKIEDDNEHLHQVRTKPLCAILTNYFAKQTHIEPIWILSDNKKTYQIMLCIEFGVASDRILQDLVKLGIGTSNDTRIFVLPTTFFLGEQRDDKNKSVSKLFSTEDITNNDLLPTAIGSHIDISTSDDLTLTRRIRKKINESNFKKSVRARLMVHQVVANIRASTALSFDFVLLLCLASMLAALGLLDNSTVIIVASMLVSPLMNPILGIVFGLSVREHSLWQQGLRNETIGLIVCVCCGFILGLFTIFAETKWELLKNFPTVEMKSRGDIKRLWVSVLTALPSGAGVALSVLGGNTGSLVGVAISASLLPPAVNCGLLFAYTVLSTIFPNVVVVHPSSLNNTKEYDSNLNCTQYINNDYQPVYACDLAMEAAILGIYSLLLTIINIICIIIMALFILRIKEVVPLHQPNEDIVNFFHHDVKIARDYNKTLHASDSNSNKFATLTTGRSHLSQSIVNRWNAFKSMTSHDNQQHQRTEQSSSIDSDVELAGTRNNNTLNIDTESRRKLFRLKTFATEYDLDVFDKGNYDLLNSDSREKVRILVNDLIDMCQEIPSVFVDLFRLQPCNIQTSTDKEHRSFYQEIIELLPPTWYQLFIREQDRRQIRSWSSTWGRANSLCAPRFIKTRKSIPELNWNYHNQSLKSRSSKAKVHFQRQSSVPETSAYLSKVDNPQIEIPVEGTRFRIARPSTAT